MKKKTENEKKKLQGIILGTVLCFISVAVIFGNLAIMYNFAEQHSTDFGSSRLQQVSSRVQKTLDNSKIMLLQFAADMEVYLVRGARQMTLQGYLRSKSRIFKDQSGNTFKNAFICTSDWIIISDSPVPENYVVSDRKWYIETKRNGIDNIYTSAPYDDAFTDEMCFTTALLLADGKTIVGIDFSPSKLQEFVAEISRDPNEEALIVNKNGTIVGYTDKSLVGQKIEDALPEYEDIYTRLLNEKNDSLVLDTVIHAQNSKVFCNRSGEWMLIYKTSNTGIFQKSYTWIWFSFILSLISISGMFFFFLSAGSHRHRAEVALENRENFLDGLSERMREPIVKIMRECAASDSTDNAHASEKIQSIRNSATTLSDMIEDLFLYKESKQKQKELEGDEQGEKGMLAITKGARDGIIQVMLTAIAVAIGFTGIVLVGWGNDRMEREVSSYNFQLENWANNQLQTLNMFVDTIAANPSVLDNYDFAVEYLDRIVVNYPEISAAYIARPGNKHEMTMNNGWVPNADYVVAERQWYVDTQNSETGINVSAPYLDARTGLYCVTFSRIVTSVETGKQIGIFALDFYIENLTSIMESSYSSTGYAFLVDNNNVIVNHPNPDYQISKEKSINIVGTEYDKILTNGDIHFIKDYDGRFKVCISRTENISGFTVVAVKNFYTVYGIVLVSACVFIILLIVCIVLLYQLAMRMIRWQEQVRQTLTEEAERASRADRAKSVFLAQMSHEIRTPINAVLGMNEMILRESSEKDILEYASNAYSAGRALLSIINDVLDISKIEAGKMEITEAEYDLHSLVVDCYNMIAARAEKKGLTLEVSLDQTLPSRLYGDMFHIRQIIVNFLTNAVKYTNEGSVVLQFHGRGEGENFILHVSVKDTGIGLKAEDMALLFGSFQRFDLKQNRAVEGTGLGLSICKQLAELMGGTVSVESEYGKGSVFSCEIPQSVTDATKVGKFAPNRLLDREELGGQQNFTAPEACILVVDDVEMNLKVFISLLKTHNLQIDTAESGEECLKMIPVKKYDIIFMDHMMPGMDGIETLEHMKQMDTLNNDTPVVMLTADAISGEKERFLKAGFADYITKPIKTQKLEQVILKYLPAEKILHEDVVNSSTAGTSTGETAPKVDSDSMFSPELGMTYTGEESYRDILKAYVNSCPEWIGRIQDFFDREDWKNYVIDVHALKSSSMTVGAKQLSEISKELELAGKAGNYDIIKAKNAVLTELFETVLALAKEFLANSEPSEPDHPEDNAVSEPLTEIDRETVLSWIENILSAAGDFDGDVITEICDTAGKYSLNGNALKPLFDEVGKAAMDFEYDEAAEKAKSIAEKI